MYCVGHSCYNESIKYVLSSLFQLYEDCFHRNGMYAPRTFESPAGSREILGAGAVISGRNCPGLAGFKPGASPYSGMDADSDPLFLIIIAYD